MTIDERVDEVLRQVRSSGGRSTSARRAILRTLFEHHDTHPTVEFITTSVQRTQPDVAESTVYRFLDELQRLDIVEHVRLGHGPGVYHLTAHTHHHHLVCRVCGAVTEIPQRLLDPLGRKVLAEYDFVVESRHLTLDGHCSTCAAEA